MIFLIAVLIGMAITLFLLAVIDQQRKELDAVAEDLRDVIQGLEETAHLQSEGRRKLLNAWSTARRRGVGRLMPTNGL